MVCVAVVGGSILLGDHLKHQPKCEKITIPMCQDMPYNLTRMPNLMNHVDQAEAAINVHEFVPLVEINCSKHLKFFLCSLYAPMCTEQVDVPIPSCQSICEKVKEGCLPFLKQFNFDWPSALNCSRLPVPEDGLCMESPDVTEDRRQKSQELDRPGRPLVPRSRVPPIMPYAYPDMENVLGSFPTTYDRRPSISLGNLPKTNRIPEIPVMKRSNVCNAKQVKISAIGLASGIECAVKCGEDVMFTASDKRFTETWMTTWAVLCFITTLLTVLTFFIDTVRFRYPERPIIFLSMCYCIYSIGYLIRIFSGSPSISCDRSGADEQFVIVEGVQSTGCIIVFIILYYFSVASCIWWVVLTVTWYLAAGKKWGHEAIESLASYFHLAAWGIPAIKTIVVLTLHKVDGDELSGLCFVGNQSRQSLLYFVIVPSCVYFLVGAVFLVIGVTAMCRIRVVMRRQRPLETGQNTGVSKFEKLMVRIGVFSLLYSVPAVCVVSCQVYEYFYRDEWTATSVDRLGKCDRGGCDLDESIPPIHIFQLKIFMSLLVGLSTGVWMWSSKTWNSWHVFCTRSLLRQNHTEKVQTNLMSPSVTVVRTYRKSSARSSAV